MCENNLSKVITWKCNGRKCRQLSNWLTSSQQCKMNRCYAMINLYSNAYLILVMTSLAPSISLNKTTNNEIRDRTDPGTDS